MSGPPPPVEASFRPPSPIRLPGRSAPDGVLRVRDGVISRLLHVEGHPVVVRGWQTRAGEVHLDACPAGGAGKEHLLTAIDRMRFALHLDDDLSGFYARFKRDELIGPVIRRKPWIRPRRRPWPWEALAGGVCQQLIESERAAAIQRHIVRSWGPTGPDGLRDVPEPSVVAGLAPAELAAADLAPKRALAMIKVAREVAAGRILPGDAKTDNRLLAIPEIGPWTVQVLGLNGRGDPDSLPAGDLAYIKLVGRLADLGRRASIEEVEEFFAPYAPFRGLAGTVAIVGLHHRVAQGRPLRYAA